MNRDDREPWLRQLLNEELNGGTDAPGPHPVADEDLLIRWSQNQLRPSQADEFRAHVARCSHCRRQLVELIETGILDLPERVESTASAEPVPSPAAVPRVSRRGPFAVAMIVATAAAMVLLAIFVSRSSDQRQLAAARRDAAEGRTAEAMDQLERLLGRTPRDETRRQARDLLAQLGSDAARRELQAGRFEAVQALADRMARFNLASGPMTNLRLRAADGQSTEIALADAATVLDYGFETDGHMRRKGMFTLTPELMQRLTRWQQAASTQRDEATLHLNLGQLQLSAREADQALAAFETARQFDPENPWAHAGRGLALFMREEFENARDAFGAALRLRPNSANEHVNLAICLERLDRAADARSHWEAARRLTASELLRRRIDRHLNPVKIDD